MKSTVRSIVLLAGLFALFQVVGAVAQSRSKRRAKPPKFAPAKVSEYFLKDVFAALAGPRPANLNAPAVAAAPAGGAGAGAGGAAAPAAKGAWKTLISSSTIEDELKQIKLRVDKDVTTPAAFKGKGYQKCRRHFSVAAMLFAIINEYDGDVRFKKSAAAARDSFAKTAANAKVGTTQVYNEAKIRKQELQDLVGGGSVQGKVQEQANAWGKIADRAPLMQRIDEGMKQLVSPALASEAAFKKKTDVLLHEIELLVAVAEVLHKDGMEDADDEDYVAFVKKMKKAGVDARDGVKSNSYEQVRKAIGAANQACDDCHELYRG